MAARRPDQRTHVPVPYTPGSRAGAQVDTINLDKSGLALDTTVQALNATLAAPAQQPTLDSLLAQIQTAGAQPYVPGLHSTNKRGIGASIQTLNTFAADSRIWRASISYAASSNSTFSGTSSMNAWLQTGGGIVLAVVELALGGPNSETWGNDNGQIPGMPIAAGDTVAVYVNNGNTITNVLMQCSCTVLFSTP